MIMLSDLIERIEALSAPDRALDEAIHGRLLPTSVPSDVAFRLDGSPAYTGSVDAALMLADRVLPLWFVNLDRYSISDNPSDEAQNFNWRCWIKGVTQADQIVNVFGGCTRTPALAVTRAVLKAAMTRALVGVDDGPPDALASPPHTSEEP